MGKRDVATAPEAEGTSPAEAQQCVNFQRCGNMATQGNKYCGSCHLEWRQSSVKREDAETRPLRAETAEAISRVRQNFARYYRSEDLAKWPEEVRTAIQAAETALAEGDGKALAGSDSSDPNPGLFQVARGIYFSAKNHLSVAEYHSSRISLQGVLKGIPGFVAREIRKDMEKAEKEFAAASDLSGFKKTRQLRNAAWAMRDVLASARKERKSLQAGDAKSFYSASGPVPAGEPIGSLLPEGEAEQIQDAVGKADTRRAKAAARKAGKPEGKGKSRAKGSTKGRSKAKLQSEIDEALEGSED